MEGGTGGARRVIVIDASTVIGAALKQGSNPWMVLVGIHEQGRVAMSEPVAAEILEVLARPKFANVLPPWRQAEIARLLFSNAHWFTPDIRVEDCRDKRDNIYLELALAANVTALVSSDKDLLVLHPWRGIPVLSATAFLARPP